MSEYYDRQGNPITLQGWIASADDTRVAETTLPNGQWISTVWLGLNHAFGDDGPPLIFETMVFPSNYEFDELDVEHYSTEEKAFAGHEAMVAKWGAK